ncbi:MAG: nucleoside deaminase [Desulfofustis sp.]|nr:nucleoside deaminase [Desulfofustis sp.]
MHAVDHHTPMRAALDEARQALAVGEFPVGCVVTHRGRIVARGARKNSKDGGEIDHAEVVTVRALLAESACPPPEELVVYSTMEPCLMCFSTLLLNGFRTIVYAYEDVMGGATGLDLKALPPLYAAMDVTVIGGICRPESLALFRRFFLEDPHGYWRDSLLARSTLAQKI